MQIHSVGIDLGKTTFHLVALGASGKALVRKKLLAYTANVRLIPAQFVKPFVNILSLPVQRPAEEMRPRARLHDDQRSLQVPLKKRRARKLAK